MSPKKSVLQGIVIILVLCAVIWLAYWLLVIKPGFSPTASRIELSNPPNMVNQLTPTPRYFDILPAASSTLGIVGQSTPTYFFPSLNIGETRISTIDGMVQVAVPAGTFLMGREVLDIIAFEEPPHMVYLDDFWIDQTEVTFAMYDLCVQAGICEYWTNNPESYYNVSSFDNHPIVYITWFYAQEYCDWADRRLPTEAEWEKVARGIDERLFPWGNKPPNGTLANFCDRNCQLPISLIVSNDSEEDDGYAQTAPVGSYPDGASPYGVLDMSGNVSEWTADWFDPYYYSESPFENPLGPTNASGKVVRGGGWDTHSVSWLWTIYRSGRSPWDVSDRLGFRCVSSP